MSEVQCPGASFKPKFYGQWPSLSVLKAKRLINGQRDGIAGMGKDALHVVTPLGLAVRNYLKEQANETQRPRKESDGTSRQLPLR